MKRPFEVLFLIALLAVVVSHFPRGDTEKPTQPELEMALTDPQIGYHLTFNRLRPGMTLTEAEAIFGPPDYRREKVNYQQWEQPLTQVHYSDQGVLTEVGGSGLGQLYLDERVVFRCGQPESDIIKTFGQPLSINDMEYSYPGMVLFCGSASGEMRWVSAITLGAHVPN